MRCIIDCASTFLFPPQPTRLYLAMKPTSDPQSSSSAPERNAVPMEIAVRAVFLEAFARELVRDTPFATAGAGSDDSEMAQISAVLDLPEGGYRPVNRLAGLC